MKYVLLTGGLFLVYWFAVSKPAAERTATGTLVDISGAGVTITLDSEGPNGQKRGESVTFSFDSASKVGQLNPGGKVIVTYVPGKGGAPVLRDARPGGGEKAAANPANPTNAAKPEPSKVRPTVSPRAEEMFQQAVKVYTSGDQAGAYKLFVQAADAGSAKAATQAGWQQEMGKGVPQSDAEAAKWYRKGADMGDPRGQKNIGSMYESGRGVPEDWVEAARWYRKSAENGDRDGQAALARAYQFGIGVPQSRDEAMEWDKKAAAQGDEEAAYFARWLADRTNNIGFRNEAERNAVIGFKMVDMFVKNEPAGRVFHNSAERNGYIGAVARRLENDMGYAHWWQAKAEYDRCQWEKKGDGCHDPGKEPR